MLNVELLGFVVVFILEWASTCCALGLRNVGTHKRVTCEFVITNWAKRVICLVGLDGDLLS